MSEVFFSLFFLESAFFSRIKIVLLPQFRLIGGKQVITTLPRQDRRDIPRHPVHESRAFEPVRAGGPEVVNSLVYLIGLYEQKQIMLHLQF